MYLLLRFFLRHILQNYNITSRILAFIQFTNLTQISPRLTCVLCVHVYLALCKFITHRGSCIHTTVETQKVLLRPFHNHNLLSLASSLIPSPCNHDLFSIFIILFFQECYVNEIIQHGSFHSA